MDFQETGKIICRICLDENVVLDWNDTLDGYCDITYKDCFYKYTQLEHLALNRFPSMLCQLCSDGLYIVHSLVLKALESHKYFKEANLIDSKLDISSNIKHLTEFETVLVENIVIEPILQDHYGGEYSDGESTINPIKDTKVEKILKRCKTAITTTAKRKKYEPKIVRTINTKTNIKECTVELNRAIESTNLPQSVNESSKESKTKSTVAINEQEAVQCDKECKRVGGQEDTIINDSNAQVESKLIKKYKKKRICSICSKLCRDGYAVKLHEKTHSQNRERTETCKICGLKFYSEAILQSHMRVHKDNREKPHKCEFCDKAFYNKGGLNIHRRIHLGQMISCNLCSKQYCRQIDLERHMSSHSAATINSETKKRSKYFVRCEYCEKSILSTSFKSHTAAHLNEPLMKCAICSKEFFRRKGCVEHLKKCHHKTNEEYKDFIIQYKSSRISHLFLQQKVNIKSAND